jgi:hypothetical protein
MMAVYAGAMAIQGERKRVVAFVTLVAAIVSAGFMGATILGGESIRERFSTLLAQDPRELYYENRGQQIALGFGDLATNYPFGAGLARWGMMRNYFREAATMDSVELPAELQPNAWMLDGGFFLLGLYSLALIATAFYEWRLVRSICHPRDRLWGATVVATNIGTLAFVFTFVPFATQVGLQYWFLEGALHGAMIHALRR